MGSFLGYANNGIIQSWDRVDELNKYATETNSSNRYYYGSDLKPGHLELVDANGDGVVNTKDRVILGSPDPDFYGGITGNLSYKNFSLYANFGFQVGGKKIYSKRLQNIPGQLCGLIDYGLNDRWSEDNPNASLPALYIGDGVAAFTSYSLMDASFFRLQEVRLTYTLPFIKVVKGSVFLSATNLFIITSYPGTDPATVYSGSNYGGNYDTSTYPGYRSYSCGFSINI
jgi:hypothetical protein